MIVVVVVVFIVILTIFRWAGKFRANGCSRRADG